MIALQINNWNENDSQDLSLNIPTRPLLCEPTIKSVLNGTPRNAILKWKKSNPKLYIPDVAFENMNKTTDL